jgi:hypothetical protein
MFAKKHEQNVDCSILHLYLCQSLMLIGSVCVKFSESTALKVEIGVVVDMHEFVCGFVYVLVEPDNKRIKVVVGCSYCICNSVRITVSLLII